MKNFILLTLLSISLLPAKEPTHLTTPDLSPVIAEIVTATNAFITSLSPVQTQKTLFPFASEQREAWGFVPRERQGLPLEALSEPQIILLRSLLKTILSDSGLKKIDSIITLEAYLAEIEKNPTYRNPKAYFTSIFGTPSTTTSWSLRYEGHHLSLNYTIIDGKTITVTPSFFATNPGEVKIDHKLKGTRPLAAEEDLARTLAIMLKEAGKNVIFSPTPPAEILTAEDRSVKQLEPVGVKASAMTPSQQLALTHLITEFASRHRSELEASELSKITSDMDNLHFGWAGSLTPAQPLYYRIQGTTFLIEVANVQNHGNHLHAVWRDSKNDFGRDLLGGHIHPDH